MTLEVPELKPRLAAWVEALMADKGALDVAVREFGSPFHVHCDTPFVENIKAFAAALSQAGVEGRVFYARKANSFRPFSWAAAHAGAGIDVASLFELQDTLRQGIPGRDIILTASAKSRAMLSEAVDAGVCVVLDNWTDLERLREVAQERSAVVMIRLSAFSFQTGAKASRFGFPLSKCGEVLEALGSLTLRGFQFHLDGYSSEERVQAIEETLPLFHEARRRGHAPSTLDIGGGFPVRYLERPEQFGVFLREVIAAQKGERAPFTYRNDGFAITVQEGEPVAPRLYPFASARPKHEFLKDILDAKLQCGRTVAQAMRDEKIEVCVEPGRALLDGAGVTIASVSHDKRIADGSRYVTLDMNQTQCRAVSLEFCVDPIWLGEERSAREPGFLTGDTCMESDLILRRMVMIPSDLPDDSLVLFPNTAGYHMHLFQSPGHRGTLPANLEWSQRYGLRSEKIATE